MNRYFFIIILILVNTSLFSYDTTVVEKLRDEMYKNELSNLECIKLYDKAIDIINLKYSDDEKNYLLAYCNYLAGRVYQRFDSIEKTIQHNREMRKGKYTSLIKYYDNRTQSILYYDKGISILEKMLDKKEEADILYLLGDCYGQRLLMSNIGYLLVKGPLSQKYGKKAKELSPKNGKILMFCAGAYIFPPAIYGGNAKKGIEAISPILKEDIKKDKEDIFNMNVGLAYCLARENRYEEAEIYIKKALEIYPKNIYALSIKKLIDIKDF